MNLIIEEFGQTLLILGGGGAVIRMMIEVLNFVTSF